MNIFCRVPSLMHRSACKLILNGVMKKMHINHVKNFTFGKGTANFSYSNDASIENKANLKATKLKQDMSINKWFAGSEEVVIDDFIEGDFEEVMAFIGSAYPSRNPLHAMLHLSYDDEVEIQAASIRKRIGNKVSIIARDRSSKKIIGTCLPKIILKDEQGHFGGPAATNDNYSMKVRQYFHIMEILGRSVNFFEKYKVDKIMELSGGAIDSKFSGKGIFDFFIQENLRRGRDIGCQLAISRSTILSGHKLLLDLGFTEEFELACDSIEINGHKVLDLKKNLGTKSFKVFSCRL